MINMNNNDIRGEFLPISLPPDGVGVLILGVGSGDIVGEAVLVEAGNIKVKAGNGNSVVVGVSEGTAEGVAVCSGVVCVTVPVGVPVLNSIILLTGCLIAA